jgi:hypothetical protein
MKKTRAADTTVVSVAFRRIKRRHLAGAGFLRLPLGLLWFPGKTCLSIEGVELLVAWYRSQRVPESGKPLRVRLHGGGIGGLAVIVVVAVVANAGLGWGHWPVHPGMGSPSYPHETTRSLSKSMTPPDTVRTVSLEAPPGHWTITGVDTADVTVEASLTARAINPEWAARGTDEATLTMTVDGNRLLIRMEIPGHRTSSPPWPEVRPTVQGIISVPRNPAANVRTSVAQITISDLDAGAEVRTATGDIDVSRVTGDVTLSTSTGTLSVAGAGGAIDLRSSTGDISVTGAPGDLRIDTSTGRVRVTDPRARLEIRTSTGNCTVNSSFPVGGNWIVRTSTGQIDVTFARGSSADILAETGTGSISNNLGFAVTGSTRKTMSGVLGDGTYEMKLSSSTGSITVSGTGQ